LFAARLHFARDAKACEIYARSRATLAYWPVSQYISAIRRRRLQRQRITIIASASAPAPHATRTNHAPSTPKPTVKPIATMIPSTASRVSFSPRSTETAALTLDVLTIAAALCSCVRAVDPHAHGFRVSPGASASRIAPQSEHWIATGIASQPHTGERRGVQARAKFRERAADTKGGMKVAEERELVGTREAAALLGLSYSCFWRLTHEGWLPSFKMSPLRNARRYVRRSHIEVLRSGGYEALQEHLHAERAASAAETNGGARSDNRVDENLRQVPMGARSAASSRQSATCRGRPFPGTCWYRSLRSTISASAGWPSQGSTTR
jgi:hypothetical protein